VKILENGRELQSEPKTLRQAKDLIAGLDLSSATTMDCREYKVINARGKVVYHRMRVIKE